MPCLSLQQIVKSFPRPTRGGNGVRRALDDLDLEVGDGEAVVVMGPSGCGKTTLLRILAGVERAESGEMKWDGRSWDQVKARERQVAMVFQHHALFPHWTVERNMGYGVAETLGLGAGEVRRRVEEMAERLGIEDLLNSFPETLSGGQRQRVSIGRALARRPQVMLLDEPFSHLDYPLRNELTDRLAELFREGEMTVVWVTQNLREAMILGDRLVVMREGKVVQEGGAEEVYSRPDDLFVAQFLGHEPVNLMSVRLESASRERTIFREEPLRKPGGGTREIWGGTTGKRELRQPAEVVCEGLMAPGKPGDRFVLGIRPERIGWGGGGGARVLGMELESSRPMGGREVSIFGGKYHQWRVEKKIQVEEEKWTCLAFPLEPLLIFDEVSGKRVEGIKRVDKG